MGTSFQNLSKKMGNLWIQFFSNIFRLALVTTGKTSHRFTITSQRTLFKKIRLASYHCIDCCTLRTTRVHKVFVAFIFESPYLSLSQASNIMIGTLLKKNFILWHTRFLKYLTLSNYFFKTWTTLFKVRAISCSLFGGFVLFFLKKCGVIRGHRKKSKCLLFNLKQFHESDGNSCQQIFFSMWVK